MVEEKGGMKMQNTQFLRVKIYCMILKWWINVIIHFFPFGSFSKDLF
jgi:hypothetical protein